MDVLKIAFLAPLAFVCVKDRYFLCRTRWNGFSFGNPMWRNHRVSLPLVGPVIMRLIFRQVHANIRDGGFPLNYGEVLEACRSSFMRVTCRGFGAGGRGPMRRGEKCANSGSDYVKWKYVWTTLKQGWPRGLIFFIDWKITQYRKLFNRPVYLIIA